jgi:hypothetical protein
LLTALQQRQTNLQTALDKTNNALTALQAKEGSAQQTLGSTPSSSDIATPNNLVSSTAKATNKKEVALKKKQATLKKALQETTAMIAALQPGGTGLPIAPLGAGQ